MQKKYKTVIIGAGPGGLRCAKILADNKEDFVLLEERKDLYRKICTGMYGLADSSLNRTRYFNLPESLFQKKIDKVNLYLGNRKREVVMNEPFVATVNRKELSEWMYKEAKNAGANIFLDSPATEIGDNYVITNGKKIFFDYLVGADGCNSIVRKKVGLKSCSGIGIQYWLKGRLDEIEIRLDPDKFGPWYAWLTPHKDIFSIGTGGDTKIVPIEKMKEKLLSCCKEKNLDISSTELEGAPIGYCYQGYRFGNKFLVGDAAGFTSGLTGEGIYSAIASGEDVAKMIIDKNHNPVLVERILNKKRKHEIILNILKNKYLAKPALNLIFYLLRFNFFKRKAISLIA